MPRVVSHRCFTYHMAGVHRWTGIYFLFVMMMCGISLATTIIVMHVHNRSSPAAESNLAMPQWVCLDLCSAATTPHVHVV